MVRGMEEDLQTLHTNISPLAAARSQSLWHGELCRQPWKSSAWDKKNQEEVGFERKHYCLSCCLKSGISAVLAPSVLEKLRKTFPSAALWHMHSECLVNKWQ